MKINAENLKQYYPFLFVGGIVGFFVYLKNRGGNTSSPSTDTTSTSEASQQMGAIADQLNSQTQDKINQLADNFNTVEAQQKDYYDNIIAGMGDKISSENDTISSLTQNLHDTQDTTATMQTKIDSLTSANSSLTSTISDLTSQLHNVQVSQTQNTPPAPTVISNPAPAQTQQSYRDYVIKKGDTLWGITGGNKAKIDQIVQLNNIKNPNLIYAGNTLRIPV